MSVLLAFGCLFLGCGINAALMAALRPERDQQITAAVIFILKAMVLLGCALASVLQ